MRFTGIIVEAKLVRDLWLRPRGNQSHLREVTLSSLKLPGA